MLACVCKRFNDIIVNVKFDLSHYKVHINLSEYSDRKKWYAITKRIMKNACKQYNSTT